METEITLEMTAHQSHAASLQRFFDCCLNRDRDGALAAMTAMDAPAAEKFAAIATHEYYGTYLDDLAECERKINGNARQLWFVTRGFGLEFATALVDLLGPYCNAIRADVTHDDDDGDIPVRITFSDGVLCADGEETSVRTFEEEIPDVWAVAPVLDADTLRQVHQTALGAAQASGFVELAQAYIELYEPIVDTARDHGLLDDLLSGDDKDEYVACLNDVRDIFIEKRNHPIFECFANRLQDNLGKFSESEYFGSVFQEYKKSLLCFYIIVDSNAPDSDEPFDEQFQDVVDQEEFDLVYEATSLLDFAE